MKCAFDRTVYCIALNEKQCRGCAFRKTHEELDAGREKADDRIASLPDEQQEYIRKKYRVFNVSASVWGKDDVNA